MQERVQRNRLRKVLTELARQELFRCTGEISALRKPISKKIFGIQRPEIPIQILKTTQKLPRPYLASFTFIVRLYLPSPPSTTFTTFLFINSADLQNNSIADSRQLRQSQFTTAPTLLPSPQLSRLSASPGKELLSRLPRSPTRFPTNKSHPQSLLHPSICPVSSLSPLIFYCVFAQSLASQSPHTIIAISNLAQLRTNPSEVICA